MGTWANLLGELEAWYDGNGVWCRVGQVELLKEVNDVLVPREGVFGLSSGDVDS